MVHATYKHLEDPIRLAGLTIGQWALLFCGALAVYGLSTLLPLDGTWAMSIALTVVGVPAAGLFVAAQADFSVAAFVRAVWRYRRRATRYLPGRDPAAASAGYTVAPVPAAAGPESRSSLPRRADLWES